MRLIDADKLMLTLNDNYLANSTTGNETLAMQDYRNAMCEGLEIAMATVEGAPTVGGWISVKNRLPGEWITVLTFQPTLSDGEGLIRTAVYIGTGKWREAERHELMELPVTHWMPLPEKPEEEAEDDD